MIASRHPAPWKVSLHGGHSGQFCAHAKGSLRETVDAAVNAGFDIYGLTEHAPRFEPEHLFEEERESGLDVAGLMDAFNAYEAEAEKLKLEFAGQIRLLRGFEAEYIHDGYTETMLSLKRDIEFDYMVGSVHHVGGICIDAKPQWLEQAVAAQGGLEKLAVVYYQQVRRMVEDLQPEVVAHLDLITKYGADLGPLDTTPIRKAAELALHTIKDHDAILDLNVYPLRKGKAHPYPAPWLVATARDMGIPFCFGDDSHAPDTVGVGMAQGREYLLGLGVNTITTLRPVPCGTERLTVEL